MKKTKLLSLLIAIAIAMVISLLPASVFAKSDTTYTVADGTNRLDDVPFYQRDGYSVTQYVIYESDLEGMKNKAITDLTWYYGAKYADVRNLEVYLSRTYGTYVGDFWEFIPISGGVKVFDGMVNLEVGGMNGFPKELTLEFDNEFVYTYGNIIVTTIDKTGTYTDSGIFYGIKSEKQTAVCRSNDYVQYNKDTFPSLENYETRAFVPKTTFGIRTPVYNVNIDESIQGGTVTVDKSSCLIDEIVTITVEPDEGYVLDTLTVTNSAGRDVYVIDFDDNSYIFTMLASDIDITALFKLDGSYNITVADDIENGTVTAPRFALEGSIVTVEATPAEGYVLKELKVLQGETEVPLIGKNQFEMPDGDVSVTAIFSDKETITIELYDEYGDGWNGNKIAAYLWDGETKTLLSDEITIKEGSTATFEFEVNVGSEVSFYWRKGEYSRECSFKITRGDYVFSASEDLCKNLECGEAIYLSTSEGEGEFEELYEIWAIVGLEGADDEGVILNRIAEDNHVLTKELEAGDYEFVLATNGGMDVKYGSTSETPIGNGSYNEASKGSEESFKLTLDEKKYVTFLFNPIKLGLSATWADNSKPGSSTIGIGGNTSFDGPFDPNYRYSASQYVIPSEMLSTLSGKVLTDITYYYDVELAYDDMCPQRFKIYLQEVERDTLETFVDISDATQVFDGSVDLIGDFGMQELTLDFDTGFTYGGGDILVTMLKEADSYFAEATFYGIDGCGVGIFAANGSSRYVASELVGEVEGAETTRFMPMNTFGYVEPVYEIINYIDGEVTVNISVPGNYSLVFAHYEDKRLDSVDIVPVTVTLETAGEISGITTDILLGSSDKIMLLSDTGAITPLCEAYIVD